MGFIALFFEKEITEEELTREDIEKFIEEKHEENIYIERARSIKYPNKKYKIWMLL